MNNNIQEDYCSFEVSKLLKEKGFKQPTLCYFFEDGEFKENLIRDTYGYRGDEYTVEYEQLLEDWNNNFLTKKHGGRCFGCSKSSGYLETYSSPTHSLAIKWIRENFGIHIEAFRQRGINGLGYNFMCVPTELGKNNSDKIVNEEGYPSPEEATEAALLYTLKNLIK